VRHTMNAQETFVRTRRGGGGRLGFYVHLTAYLAVNALLIGINLITSTERLWFKWPLLGWGVGITIHAAVTVLLSQRARIRNRESLGTQDAQNDRSRQRIWRLLSFGPGDTPGGGSYPLAGTGTSASSASIQQASSPRRIRTSPGASIPSRTRPSSDRTTVTVTLFPMTTFSPIFRVSTSIAPLREAKGEGSDSSHFKTNGGPNAFFGGPRGAAAKKGSLTVRFSSPLGGKPPPPACHAPIKMRPPTRAPRFPPTPLTSRHQPL